MRRSCLALSLALALSHGAEDVIKIPVQIDQEGTTMDFVTDSDSDVYTEALRFCRRNVPIVPKFNECANKLLQQVEALRRERREAIDALPDITKHSKDEV